MVRPIPCPPRSRITENPALRTSCSITRPISETRTPARATSMASLKAVSRKATFRPTDASEMAKRWFKSQNSTGPSHKTPARLGSSGLSLLGAPEKWGRKRRHFHVLLELSNDRRICWGRPGAAPSAEQQRLEIQRSSRRNAALVQERQ